jgi:hypothetical protein
MREIIYLTQDEIDTLVQTNNDITKADYCKFRAFQDGDVAEVTTPFKIYRREDAKSSFVGSLKCLVEDL